MHNIFKILLLITFLNFLIFAQTIYYSLHSFLINLYFMKKMYAFLNTNY